MKSWFLLPRHGEDLLQGFATPSAWSSLNQRALFLDDLYLNLIQYSPITVEGWKCAVHSTTQVETLITLPSCSLKMSFRRSFVSRWVVQHWNSLVWDLAEARGINGFPKTGHIHGREFFKRQDATFILDKFKANVYGKLERLWVKIILHTPSLLLYCLWITYYQSPFSLKKEQWTR